MRVQATSGAGVKFANPLKGGKIECYYKGVTSITGPPSGDLEKSVEDEHRKLATCDEEFSTGNYGVTTCPKTCLLYTSPSPRDKRQSRMPSSA